MAASSKISNLQEPVKDQCTYGTYCVRFTNEAGFPVNWYFEYKKDAEEFYQKMKKEMNETD